MLKRAGGIHRVTLDGREYVLVPRQAWETISSRALTRATSQPDRGREDGSLTIGDVRRSLARRVSLRRQAAGWTQRELARRAGVRVETISRIENGLHMPGPRTSQKIETALSASKLRRRD